MEKTSKFLVEKASKLPKSSGALETKLVLTIGASIWSTRSSLFSSSSSSLSLSPDSTPSKFEM